MRANRFTAAFATLLVSVVVVFSSSAVRAGEDADALHIAVKHFEGGDFLTAQEVLTRIDRSKLSQSQQSTRDDYLNRVQVALTMAEKALRDLEDAETALTAKEYDRAEALLKEVLSNSYAAPELRNNATARLREVETATGRKSTTVSAPIPAQNVSPDSQPAVASQEQPGQPQQPKINGNGNGERARTLTLEAEDMIQAGRFAEAERLFQQALVSAPGYPEAVDGIKRARQHASMAQGALGESLIDRMKREDTLSWQRTATEYREAEQSIRGYVAAEQFEQANQTLTRARQIVESGRAFADPIALYESLRSELDALVVYVQDQERLYHETKVSAIRRDIEEQRSDRLRQTEENRARQVDALMTQALQHRKDGDLEGAVNVLRQITNVDPKNQQARWLMDILEDQRQYRKQRDLADQKNLQFRETMIEVEEAKIPWHEMIKYPKDWVEIINRPERGLPGSNRPDSQLHAALDRPIQVDFPKVPFEEVMTQLADAHRLNFIVNWHDLHRAGVERSTPIDFRLPREITLKKALTEILIQAGGPDARLGYDVSDGAMTIATQSFLDKKTYAAMYDINDLLFTVPKWDRAPMTDLRHANQTDPPPKISAAVASQQPWRAGDDDDDEAEESPERLSRVQKIIDVIQENVFPDSWRERGGSVGTVKEINGQLVITQNSAAHREIGDLLSKLREEKAIQVAVEAVFITVSSHYLEDLGMNVNFVLNGGNAGLDFIPGGAGPAVDPVLGNRLLLPRTFSRLGFTPNTPAIGTGLNADPNLTPTPQPFGQPYLIPQRQGGGGSQLTPVPVRSNFLDITNPANQPSDIPGSFGGQNIGPALSVFGSFLDNIQVDFLIRATQADSRTSVVTAPRVVVFNGFGAWVAVTVQQNFVSTLAPVIAQGAVAQQPVIGTIDAGAVLNIQQAVVSADKRYVMMTLNPGVTRLIDLQTFQFSGGTLALDAFIQIPTLSSLRIQTAVMVPDGGTLLIGGQKLASESEVEAGVPVLSKIPILKRAYSSRSTVKDEQTLLILIKPKVLIQSEQEELAFPSFAHKRG
ncbi:MAG: hypothetical protein AABZ47_04335 [Planctomycetota bacterium]